MTYSATGIVLRRTDVREWDRLYTVLTREHGKLMLVGKGTRRPKAKLAAHCEPLAEVDFEIARGRQMDRIIFARALRTNEVFATSHERFTLASFLCECVDALTKDAHPDPELYDLLRDALGVIARKSATEAIPAITGSDAMIVQDANTIPPLPSGGGGKGGWGMSNDSEFTIHHPSPALSAAEGFIIPPFLLRLLSLLGYTPILDRCVDCRREVPEGPTIGIPYRGGIICKKCRSKHDDGIVLTPTDRTLIAACIASFVPQPTTQLVAIFADQFLAAHLSHPLRTMMVGKDLSSSPTALR